MLIDALCRYYDILSVKGELTKEGYTRQDTSYIILLTPEGQISDIADHTKENDKGKRVPISELLPQRTQKPGIDSNFIEHRPFYIFGLDVEKDKDSGEIRYLEQSKAIKSHKAFVERNLEITEGIESPIVKAYRNFILNWVPENETENPHLKKIVSDYSKKYYCFGLDGHPEIMLHEDKALLERWEKERAEKTSETGDKSFCPITGKLSVTERVHNKIKAIAGGNSTGGVLIGVNKTAEESYGKTQGYNSNLSVEAAKMYTAALNYLLEDKAHHCSLDGMTVVYWAMSRDDKNETDIMNFMLGNISDDMDSEEVNRFLSSHLEHIKKGISTDISKFDIDENVEFYIAGFTPNSSRISMKMLMRDRFGNILDNIIKHQSDIYIEGSKKTGRETQLGLILKEMRNPNSKDDKIPSPTVSLIIKAIIMGYDYPQNMLEHTVRRIKTGKETANVRAGIIKACINRKSRFNNKEEEIKVSLDKENKNEAYLCGRLFSVLEYIQYTAAKPTKLNRTIKDTYFSSACSNPSVVFPKLMKLAQYHLSKIEGVAAVRLNKEVQEITGKLGQTFPTTLSLVDQGKFILGYYQQTEYKFSEIANYKDNKENEEA